MEKINNNNINNNNNNKAIEQMSKREILDLANGIFTYEPSKGFSSKTTIQEKIDYLNEQLYLVPDREYVEEDTVGLTMSLDYDIIQSDEVSNLVAIRKILEYLKFSNSNVVIEPNFKEDYIYFTNLLKEFDISRLSVTNTYLIDTEDIIEEDLYYQLEATFNIDTPMGEVADKAIIERAIEMVENDIYTLKLRERIENNTKENKNRTI